MIVVVGGANRAVAAADIVALDLGVTPFSSPSWKRPWRP